MSDTSPARLAHDAFPGAARSGAPTVVLLHGLTQQRRFWLPVVRRLQAMPGAPTVVAVDLRGHGDSDRPEGGTYDVPTCAADVAALLDGLGVSRAVVVGHSWGASVAVALAASEPSRTAALVALDGGFIRLLDLGDRAEVRERLLPPRLGVPLEQVIGAMSGGALGPWWSDEVQEALLPTFEVGEDGMARTRLGYDRHLQVLDGLLDFDPVPALAAITAPAWLVRCEPVAVGEGVPWRRAGEEGLARAAEVLAQPRVLRWAGALHDVPLQWPWLVAGAIRSAVDEVTPAASSSGSVAGVRPT